MATLSPPMTHVYIHTRLSRYTSHHPMDRLKLYTYVTHMLCLHTHCVCVSLSISVCTVCVQKGGTVFQLREFFMSPLDWTFESGSRRSFFFLLLFSPLWQMVESCAQSKSEQDNGEDRKKNKKKIKTPPKKEQTRKQSIKNPRPHLPMSNQKRIGKGDFLMRTNSFS